MPFTSSDCKPPSRDIVTLSFSSADRVRPAAAPPPPPPPPPPAAAPPPERGGVAATAASASASKPCSRDDPIGAAPVHFFAGAWGLFAPAFFARPYNMRNAYGHSKRAGLFYGGGGEMLACQTVGFVAITAWVTVTMLPFFTLMNKLGMFRVSPEVEEIGCDDSKHGGSAYSLGALPAIDLEKIEKQIEGEMNA